MNDTTIQKIETTLPPKPRIIYTPLAWTKQQLLILSQSGEIGWHGVVEVLDENVFRINDILVYPQQVTSAQVSTEDAEYTNWLYELSDEQFNGLKAHFHSHVNMSPTPSGVDEADKAKIIEQLQPDGYYIFMIWNKRYEFTADIYDCKNMIRWSAKDISVEIEGLGDINEWITKATEIVKEKKEVKSWIWQKVSNTLIQPQSETVYKSSAVAQSVPHYANYSRDWD